MNPLVFFDYAGVAVFAATGALAASRKQLDILGFIFLAAATGIGGGTLRDLVLGVPVFWTVNQDYILVCAAVAVIVYFTAHRLESRYKLLLWLDAVGLAAYCVYGAYKGLVVTGSATVAVVTGVMTAAFCATCSPPSLRCSCAPKSTSPPPSSAPPPSPRLPCSGWRCRSPPVSAPCRRWLSAAAPSASAGRSRRTAAGRGESRRMFCEG